ncbi:hypothetical protein GCM10010266_42230 [Streptomyces griseomycini]|nr:hypothetical protein GCM10010266_42230 [Streptomyces griseomycini]GGR24620.1 hypothetical protein GCM10015536_32880 [Streptomyces griseomycini]
MGTEMVPFPRAVTQKFRRRKGSPEWCIPLWRGAGGEFTDGESDPVPQLVCDPGLYPPHGWLTLAQPAQDQQGG